MALVHVVIVNWNGWADTVECLDSLLELDWVDVQITVCDNGSEDGSVGKLAGWFAAHPGRGVIVENGKNLGFAGGCNVGIARALADGECGYVWLLNNDTVVMPGALTALVALMEAEPDIAVCGSTLLYHHQPEMVQGLGGWFNPWIGRGGHLGQNGRADALPSRAEIEGRLDYVIGASMLVRRAVFERIGGLSEEYFLYFEELDLARRLLVGERQAWARESVVYHKEGRSIGSSSSGRPSDTSLYYLQVNLLRFYRRHHPWLLPIALARLGREAAGRDRKALAVSWLALRDFATGKRRTGPL
jgi:GT2 family glycosyltransferase